MLISLLVESLIDKTQENLQVLLTFNGKSYDLRIFNFLVSNYYIFPDIFEYSCCLFNNQPWSSRFGKKLNELTYIKLMGLPF